MRDHEFAFVARHRNRRMSLRNAERNLRIKKHIEDNPIIDIMPASEAYPGMVYYRVVTQKRFVDVARRWPMPMLIPQGFT